MIDATLAQAIFQATISMASISLALVGVLQVMSGLVSSSKVMKEIDKLAWTRRLKKNFRLLKVAVLIFSCCTFISLTSVIINQDDLSILSIGLFIIGVFFLLWPLKNLDIAPE